MTATLTREPLLLCLLASPPVSNTIVHEAAVHSDAEEVSIYKLMEKHGMTSAVEKDRNDHQQVKQAMAEVDTSTQALQADGLDVHARRVQKACDLFLQHAEVRIPLPFTAPPLVVVIRYR